MSIRLRLTLLYTLILTITLIGFSVASYFTVARDGLNRLQGTLESKVIRIAEDPLFRLEDIQQAAHLYAGPEFIVQSRDSAGAVLDQTSNFSGRILPLNLEKIDGNEPRVEVIAYGEERWLVYNLSLAEGLVQIAGSMADRDRGLANLARVLAAGNILVIGVAFGMGWVLAGFGLRPIFRLSQVVQTIGRRRDFGRRVNYGGPNDEIGQLAAAFDQMLAELEDAYQQTETALKTQRRFVADASHELRTPLTTIRGNLELLRRVPPIKVDDRTAVLTDLVDETDRLIRLVNELLLLARTDVQPERWREPVHLRPLLEIVARQVQRLAPERQMVFRPLENDRLKNEAILGHADALKQVLLVLLDNAVKHTPDTAKIVVDIDLDSTAGWAHILICDTGPGIPAKEIPRLFDRFYVVDPSRTRESTGLGLAIARTLVESQSGRIEVTSRPKKGTTFKVTLPCR